MRSTRNVNATDAALAAGARTRSRSSKKKSRRTSDSYERRLKRERDVMGAEAQALTKNINQGVTSLLNNVYQLDYGEVMKLRTSVREWTGEVDRVFERMRKEFSVTPAGV
jgi:PBP1b-binding outer membrane lipoprotein LpoB